jgi:sensor histidine kinase YesM
VYACLGKVTYKDYGIFKFELRRYTEAIVPVPKIRGHFLSHLIKPPRKEHTTFLDPIDPGTFMTIWSYFDCTELTLFNCMCNIRQCYLITHTVITIWTHVYMHPLVGLHIWYGHVQKLLKLNGHLWTSLVSKAYFLSFLFALSSTWSYFCSVVLGMQIFQ